MKLPDRQWRKMDDAMISAADCSKWICVLSLGAHEQHGPHLPFETDTIIANGIALRLAQRLDADLPVSFLDVEATGYSPEHMDFEGSRTLSYQEALSRWIGIGEQLAKKGIRKLLLLNAHGGNSPLMTIVATELRVRFDMLCVTTSWTRFVEAGELMSAHEKAYGIHGGDIETSVMLALKPELVDMERAENFLSFQEEITTGSTYLQAYGRHAFGWKIQDLNPRGVVGNASEATRQKGEAMLETALQGLLSLISEMHRFDLRHFDN